MIYPHRQHHWLAALVASCFLIATTLPRFGTVGHRHEAGRTPHVHLSYAATHASPKHQDDRHHRQATHALPFGGVYAYSSAPHEHSPSPSRDTARSRKAIWMPADFHWHFDHGAMPPGVTVAALLEPLGYGLYLTPTPPLSVRTQTRFDIRPRGPPL